MKLKKFLKYSDLTGFTIIIYSMDDEDHPLYEGTSIDVPWWLADLKLATPWKSGVEEPVSFRSNLGDAYNNKPGFVITVVEE